VLEKKHSAKCQKKTLGKETLCRVLKIKHSAKSFFAECFILPRVFCVAFGKELLCRVPEIKHSAKNMTLGKEPNSGSATKILFINYLFVVRVRHRLRVMVLSTRIVALTRACHALSRALFCVYRACRSHALSHVVCVRCHVTITCVTRRLRVIINSLSLVNTHVNNVNTSCHIF
jgi:hypothetical protein